MGLRDEALLARVRSVLVDRVDGAFGIFGPGYALGSSPVGALERCG